MTGDGDGFRAVLRYIDRQMAFEPDSYNESYLDRRISARMGRRDVDDYRAYLDVLSSDPEEPAALLDSLSINVTGFFRNPPVWERLRDVLRRLTDDARRVRCWSAPCADGREPYSLAMLARDDPDVDAAALEITATDIDEEALAAAREGRYTGSRTTDLRAQLEPLSAPTDHVALDGDTVTVRDEVRRMVEFERHDLISGRARTGHDLVLCRNLLIYIDADYKEPIFETLTDAVRTDGFLTIGKSETLPLSYRDAYEPFDKKHHIYRKR